MSFSGCFFLRMAGDAPDLAVDEQVAYLVAELVKPAGVDLGALVSMMVVVMMLGMFSTVVLRE